jgi:hypothetical protein
LDYLNPSSKLRLNESVGPKVLRFSYSFSIETHMVAYYAYHNFKIKHQTSFKYKY